LTFEAQKNTILATEAKGFFNVLIKNVYV